MNTTATNVRSFYEKYPYPNYPLLAKIRWQDGYMASSLFVKRLAGIQPSQNSNYLAIGPGEALPYVISKWEKNISNVHFVEPSSRSVSRAKVRTLFTGGENTFHNEYILDFFEKNKNMSFDHVDSFGVFHHLADPELVLQKTFERMKPNSTMRLMVYNSAARDWIWRIHQLFKSLKLKWNDANDVKLARDFLLKLSPSHERVQNYFKNDPSGSRALTRFVDTFMHPHELRTPVERWFEMFEDVGLTPIGIFDRYAELDDLPNPMWKCPTLDQLVERAADLRWENNLEIFLTKKNNSGHPTYSNLKKKIRIGRVAGIIFNFNETRELSFFKKNFIWQSFLEYVFCEKKLTGLEESFSLQTLQRLARLGIILPDQVSEKLSQSLLQPMTDRMETPVYFQRKTQSAPDALKIIFHKKSLDSESISIASKRYNSL